MWLWSKKLAMRCFVVIVCLGLVSCGGSSVTAPERVESSENPTPSNPVNDRDLVYFTAPGAASYMDAHRARGDYESRSRSKALNELTKAERNERAVIPALEHLVFAQTAAVFHDYVDADANGIGEPLFLAEILGIEKVRGTDRPFEANRELMSRFERRLERGRARFAGYLFQVWLRGESGEWITDGSNKRPSSSGEWRCYAWPVDRGVSGRLAYYVDHTGEILGSSNVRAMYEGHEIAPAPDAAEGERSNVHDDDTFMGSDRGRWARIQVYVPPAPPR